MIFFRDNFFKENKIFVEQASSQNIQFIPFVFPRITQDKRKEAKSVYLYFMCERVKLTKLESCDVCRFQISVFKNIEKLRINTIILLACI